MKTLPVYGGWIEAMQDDVPGICTAKSSISESLTPCIITQLIFGGGKPASSAASSPGAWLRIETCLLRCIAAYPFQNKASLPIIG